MDFRRYLPIGGSIFLTLLFVVSLFWVDRIYFQYPDLTVSDTLSPADYQDRVSKYHSAYDIWTVTQNQRNFEWNLRSTKIIFWVSMLVSVSGIVFSFWQFADAATKEKVATNADELKIKTELFSLAFKARSVAALVLFVSIAYLLVYVKFVYPIRFVATPLNAAASVQDDNAASISKQDIQPEENNDEN